MTPREHVATHGQRMAAVVAIDEARRAHVERLVGKGIPPALADDVAARIALRMLAALPPSELAQAEVSKASESGIEDAATDEGYHPEAVAAYLVAGILVATIAALACLQWCPHG